MSKGGNVGTGGKEDQRMKREGRQEEEVKEGGRIERRITYVILRNTFVCYCSKTYMSEAKLSLKDRYFYTHFSRHYL